MDGEGDIVADITANQILELNTVFIIQVSIGDKTYAADDPFVVTVTTEFGMGAVVYTEAIIDNEDAMGCINSSRKETPLVIGSA